MSSDNNPNQIPILDAEADLLAGLAAKVRAFECHLGALRHEYITQETSLLGALKNAYEEHDALLKAVGRRHCADLPGLWTYDPSSKSLVNTGNNKGIP